MASGFDKTSYTHYIAIDFGTSGCGIVLSTSANEKPRLFSKWLPSQTGVAIKCPSVLLLNHNKECEAFGLKARENYHKKGVKRTKEFNNYYLFEYFKMSLYEEKVPIVCVAFGWNSGTYCMINKEPFSNSIITWHAVCSAMHVHSKIHSQA